VTIVIKKAELIALLILVIFLAWTRTLQAAEFNRVLPEKSHISFVYKQMNVPMEGSFQRFVGQLSFDPDKPASTKAYMDIDLASIDTGALDADEEVRGKPWFNTSIYPQAQFVSGAIKAVAPNHFDMNGKLTIKGRTRDVTLPVTFRRDGANVIFEGALVLKRADFGIGEGVWADFGTVANEVQVKIRLLATTGIVKQ